MVSLLYGGGGGDSMDSLHNGNKFFVHMWDVGEYTRPLTLCLQPSKALLWIVKKKLGREC